MSANNQTLIIEHKGRFYVYDNVMAESWGEVNELGLSCLVYDDKMEAIKKAEELDKEYDTEYGIHFNELAKDGAEVIIKD